MRGLAALVAAASVWVLVTGRFPTIRPPRVRLPAPWVVPAAVAVGLAAGLLALGLLGVPAVAAAIGALCAAVPVGIEITRRIYVPAGQAYARDQGASDDDDGKCFDGNPDE